jgi:diadenosine tetraphosphate (Ap4A) HIT family hydrolase
LHTPGADDADYVGELLPYINGEKSAPVPTYFIGGFGLGSSKALAALATAPNCNIKYLGRAGVAQIHGLQIAFLDGTYNAAAYRGASLATAGEGDEANPITEAGACRHFSSSDVDSVKLAVANAEGDIDFLLTNGWPAALCTGLPEAALPPDRKVPQGSEPCAELAVAVRPRYHIAGGEQFFYTRAPYLNIDLGAGTLATRFISLGNVGNTTKQKWLHALGVIPASQMTPEELSTSPQGATKSPYLRLSGKRAAAGQPGNSGDDDGLGEQSWRWQDRTKRARAPIAAPSLGRADVTKDKTKTAFVRNVPFRATEDDILSFFSQAGAVVDVVRRTNQEGKLNSYCHVQFDTKEAMERSCQLNGSEFMGRQIYIEPASTEERPTAARQVQPVQGCWFCLSNPNADTALVASVGEECYVALDKGPITDRHVLLLPVEHYACTLETPSSTTAEIDRYMSALKSCFAAEGKELIAFERYMRLKKSGGNHCHVNAIAVPADAGKNAAIVFESVASRYGFGFTRLPPASGQEAKDAITSVVHKGEYFLAFLPDGSRLVHPIAYGERHPLNFGREVLAELAGVPHRADWKECQGTPEEEAQRTEAFRTAFKGFDIMLQ